MNNLKSKRFKEFFILEFAKDIIRATHSYQEAIIKSKINKNLKKEEKISAKRQIKNIINKKISTQNEKISSMKDVEFLSKNKWPKIKKPLHHIKPPSTIQKIDFGKIGFLIKNPKIKSIECPGPYEKIIIEEDVGKQTIPITLNENEIRGIIKEFSRISRNPISEGFLKITIGRLTLSALISEIVSSKFVITKMPIQNINLSPTSPSH